MKKLLLAFGFFVLAINVFAQNEKAQQYINAYKDIAIAEMIRGGVPASITLAQGILESGYGQSVLCQKSNNHFGIKCKENWTGKTVYHDDDLRGECFRAYESAADSYKDHSEFLKTREWYAFLFKLDPTDYEGWAKGLKKAGYATEKDYPQRLIQLITNYNLQQYTLLAIKQKENNGNNVASTEASTSTAAVDEKPVVVAVEVKDEEKDEPIDTTSETVINPNKQIDSVSKKQTKYPEGILTINHVKATYAKEGTSLLSLANQFGITLSKLIDFNDIEEMDVLDTDRLIFVEKKQKKGATDFHVVAEGECVHDICQAEGVQLESLLAYNKLKKSSQLKKGEKIYLRPITPTKATK